MTYNKRVSKIILFFPSKFIMPCKGHYQELRHCSKKKNWNLFRAPAGLTTAY